MDERQQGFFLGPDAQPDKYRLLQQFGAGGEAQLWRATLPLAGESEPVAVKVLRAELYADFAGLSRRWSEQAELLRFVRHPGVVGVREHFEGAPVHAAGRADATPGRSLCLVMNWVEGHSLRDWLLLNPGREGLLATLTHLEQIAEVLDWLHSGQATPSGREIVHGDLSPGNVLISSAGQAVLVDFGLARVAAHRTVAPAFTPGYAAPEVWNAGEYSPASDRYGFGAIGYFLLTGESPPHDPARLRAGLAAVPVVAGGRPDRLDVLLRVFDPDPARRPSALTWVRALRDGATTAARRFDAPYPATAVPPPSPQSFPPSWGPSPQSGPHRSVPQPVPSTGSAALTEAMPVVAPAPPRRRRWRLVTGLVLVAALLLVGGGIALGQRIFGSAPVAAPTTSAAAAPATTLAPVTASTPVVPTTPALSTGSALAGPSTAPVGSGALTYLADVDPIIGNWAQSGTLAVDGRTYAHTLIGYCSPSRPENYEYDLGRRYSTFTTLVGMSDFTDSAGVSQLEFFRDGLAVATVRVQRGSTQTVSFPVGGALTLKVVVSTIERAQCTGNSVGPTLADPQLVS